MDQEVGDSPLPPPRVVGPTCDTFVGETAASVAAVPDKEWRTARWNYEGIC